MGYGDEIMGSGLARGARARGKRIAFGDGNRILWTPQAHEIFRNNPNVARPGSERAPDIEWIRHYKGHRLYHQNPARSPVRFNPAFRAIPGEMFFDERELEVRRLTSSGFIIVEPHVKEMSPNKQWPMERWQIVADVLRSASYDVAQFSYSERPVLFGVRPVITPDFRISLAILSRAALVITSEGGLHHGSACFGVPAVVLFGGHTHPRTTGYDGHINLYVGDEPCGMGSTRSPCTHCYKAMQDISTDMVIGAAMQLLSREAA